MATANTTKKPAAKPAAPAQQKKAVPVKVLPATAKNAEQAPTPTPAPVLQELKELLHQGQATAVEAQSEEPAENASGQEIGLEKVQPEEAEAEVEVQELKKDVLLICRKECMTCNHLCPETGRESPTNCHYDNGNEDCPARTTLIQMGMSRKEIEKAANAIVEATANSDFERLAKASERLSQKSESVRASVSKRVIEINEERKVVA